MGLRSLVRAAIVVLALAGARSSHASCGAESCPLDLRAAHSSDDPLSFGLAWQYVPQDHVRVGTQPGVVGQPPSPEDEVSTLSSVVSATAQVRLSERFRLEATVPFVDRTHTHDAHRVDGPPQRMTWDFLGLGDAQLLGVLRVTPQGSRTTVSLQGGVKCPTGRREVDTVDGEQPEPSARPGTGSWDGLAGVHLMRSTSPAAPAGGRAFMPVFLGILGRWNGRGTEDYRVGHELQLNAGSGYPIAGPVTLLAQVNARFRGHDDPGHTDALPANTGGTWVFISPGISVATGRGASVYGYVQLPVYQRVNRIQIVAPWMLQAGVSIPLAR